MVKVLVLESKSNSTIIQREPTADSTPLGADHTGRLYRSGVRLFLTDSNGLEALACCLCSLDTRAIYLQSASYVFGRALCIRQILQSKTDEDKSNNLI